MDSPQYIKTTIIHHSAILEIPKYQSDSGTNTLLLYRDDEGAHVHSDFSGLVLQRLSYTRQTAPQGRFYLRTKPEYSTGAGFKANVFSPSSHVIHSEMTHVNTGNRNGFI